MPLGTSSISFVRTNNPIDLNGINQVSRIQSGNVHISNRSSTVGGNSLCWGPRIRASVTVERRCYSSQAPAWPHSCPLAAGTSTGTGKFTSETFSQSQLKQGCGHIRSWPQSLPVSAHASSWFSREKTGDQSLQFTTKSWVIAMAGLAQETDVLYILKLLRNLYCVCIWRHRLMAERKAQWKEHPSMKDAKEELKEGQKFYLQSKENIVH